MRKVKENENNSNENILEQACRNLKVDKRKIEIIYERKTKINVEFERMEDKLQAMESKGQLRGTDI